MTKILTIFLSLVCFILHAQNEEVISKVFNYEETNFRNTIVIEPINIAQVNESIIDSKKEIRVLGNEKKEIRNIIILEPIDAIPASKYKHGNIIKKEVIKTVKVK